MQNRYNGEMGDRVRKAGEPHWYADSSIHSNNGRGDWTKKGRKEREREACCRDCSESGKGGGERRREQFLADSCYSNSDVNDARERHNTDIHLQKRASLCVCLCVKAAGACVRDAFQH